MRQRKGLAAPAVAQMPIASQMVFRRALGGGTRRYTGARRRAATRATANNRRRSYASGPKATRARSNRRSMSKPARMVKGSAAAKRYMAKLRRMRKR